MKLNETQQKLLREVAEVKAQVDADIATRRANFERGVELDKAPLYDVVALAAAAKIPARQLGMVLGTSDHKTIKSYFPAREAQ